MKMTILILLLAGGMKHEHFVSHQDLSRFNGLSVTISAQPTKEMERLQDELHATFTRFDPILNLNVPALHRAGEYHGLPDGEVHEDVKMIHIHE